MQTWIMSKCDKISGLSLLFHLSIDIMRGGPSVQRNIPFSSGLPLVLFDHQRTLPGVVRHDQHGAGRDHRQDSADHLHLLQCWLLLGSSSLQGDLIQEVLCKYYVSIMIFLTNVAVLSR